MKKYAAVAIIIILFLFFAIFNICKRSYTPVFKVINPYTFQVDLNNNGVINDNETICLPDFEAFSLSFMENAPDFSDKLNLDSKTVITLGYLADNFSNSYLLSKPVKVKFNGQKSKDCRFADVYLADKSYSDILLESGYAAKSGKFNEAKLKENISASKNIKLVIYNIKSNKYHELDCKYGLISSDYSVIPEKQLPKDAKPCKFCHVEKIKKSSKSNDAPVKKLKAPEEVFTEGNISLLINDFTKVLRPNRNCDSEACIALLKSINSANNSIDIAVYGMDVIPKIYDALLRAKSRGVKIRIVYDKSSSPELDYYNETENIVKLADESATDYVPEKASYTNQLMHNKFFIFDNKVVMTGSMNISNTGISGYNANAVLFIDSPEIAELYTYEFEQMLSGKFHQLKTKSSLSNTFNMGNTKLQIYFSPYDKVSDKIIPIFNDAKSYIYLPVFLITHNGISDALISAKRRGVDVKIIIDANSTSTRNTKYKILRDAGIPLKTENYAGKLHSKSIIIDDKYVITGSMNLSNSGENKNDENTLIIENSKFAKEYKEYFLYLWDKIPDIYLFKNARAEGKESIGACSDGIDNDFDGFVDSADPGCR